jgi:hypothetical protein
MANPIDREGLELARTINAKLVAIRADIVALETALGNVSSAWDDITGKPAAVTALTGTNTGDQDISGKLDSTTAASTYAPISTTVATSGTQTVNGTKTFGSLATNGTVVFGAGTTFFADTDAATSARSALATNDAANITTGNIAVARIATALTTPGAIGGTTPAAISATTVTASGAVSVAAGIVLDVIESGSAKTRIQNGDVQYYNSAGNRKLLLGSNGIGLALASDYSIAWSSSSTEAYSPRDVRIRRTGTNTITVDNNSGGAGNLAITGTLAVTGAATFGSYTVGTVPSVSTYVRGMTYVSDESGGATLAYSNGTNWKRVYDNANIS